MNPRKYIDLQAGAQALADMSNGQLSAQEALSQLIRVGISDEFGELSGLTPVDSSDISKRADASRVLRERELTDLIGSEDEFREPYVLDEMRRNNDDYQYALDQEVAEINELIEVAKERGNRDQAKKLRKFKIDRVQAKDEEQAYAAAAGNPTPKAALQDALGRLQMGTGMFGYDAFPGSADVAGRLEEALDPGRAGKQAEKALSGELARRDAKRFQPFWKNVNDVKAIIRYEQALRNGDIVMPDAFNQPNQLVRPFVSIVPDQEQLMRSTGRIPYGPIELDKYGLTKDLTWQNVIPRAGKNVAPPAQYGPALPERPHDHQPHAQLIFDALTNTPVDKKIDVSVSAALNQLNSGVEGIKNKYNIPGGSNIQTPQDLRKFARGFYKWAMNQEKTTRKTPIVGYRDSERKIPIPVKEATLTDILATAGLGRADQQRLGLALSQVALSGGTYGPRVAMRPASVPDDPRRQVTRNQSDIGFEYDEDGGTKGRRIQYQYLDKQDNKAAPGTRGVTASSPPKRAYTVTNKKTGRTREEYGPAIFDLDEKAYVPMRRTVLRSLFEDRGVEGPPAMLAEDVGLDRTKVYFNSFGETESPRALRKLIVDQAAKRAQKTNKELNLHHALQNADRAIGVTRRARRDNAARKERNRAYMQFAPYNRILRGGF